MQTSAAVLLGVSLFAITSGQASAQVTTAAGAAPRDARSGIVEPHSDSRLLEIYRGLPLRFEQNRGQTHERVKFLSRHRGYTLFLTSVEAVVALNPPSGPVGARVPPATFRLEWVGANPSAVASGFEELPARSNYLIGNDPRRWHTGIPSYAKVRYREIYPGVDLLYYGNEGHLEYDLIVAPGARADVIRFGVRGAEKLQLDRNGDLIVHLGQERVRLRKPVVYQPESREGALTSAARELIPARYVLKGLDEVRFELGVYDPSRSLIIDPQVTYSSYLGGSGNDSAQKVAVDSAGHAYLVGFTRSLDFPVASPVQANNAGLTNAFISKLNPGASGTASLIYSTYLGGSGSSIGRGIAVDAVGDVYLVGDTNSPDFPVTPGAYQVTCKLSGSACSSDVFAARLDASGSLLGYSTYLGGTGSEFGFALAVDDLGRIFVTGPTGSSNFPVTAGSYQSSFAGGGAQFGDAFVAALNPVGGGASDLVYSTYLGGSGSEQPWDVAIDFGGAVYVAGSTTSGNFPTSLGAYSRVYAGTANLGLGDAFVAKLQPAGLGATDLVYSTYLGGAGDDRAEDLVVDAEDRVYVTGLTSSSGFPITPSIAYQTTFGGGTCNAGPCADAFVAKLDPSASGSPSLLYSTFFGGSSFDIGHAIALDSNGFIYVAGETGSPDFPLMNPIQDACSGGCTGLPMVDLIVAKFDLAQFGTAALLFSTYLGGNNVDTAWGAATDSDGNVYVSGQVFSTNFPTVIPFQSLCRNCSSFTGPAPSGDGFLVKVCTTACPSVALSATSLTFVTESVGASSPSQRLTLSNSGAGPLTIAGISVTGENAADFAQTNDCPIVLPGQASCPIDVTFVSTAAGPRAATVTIADNAPGSPRSVGLTGIVGPLVTVTAPNTAASWSLGSTQTISWSHNLGTTETVNIDVSRDGGATWVAVASAVANAESTSGSFAWTVSGPSTAQARIRVSWAANPSVSDVSDVNFTIPSLFVTVTSPNTNVKWRVGETRNVKFDHNLGVGRVVNIDVSRDNGTTWSSVTAFTTTKATSGTYAWVVSGPATTQARIRVSDPSDLSVTDVSNVSFTILAPVTVTAPNSALIWGAGSTRQVTWNHNLGTSETVNIDFSADGGGSWMSLAAGVPNATATTGSWTGPMPSIVTTQARIRVTRTSNPADFDLSDVNFTLAMPAITVKAPNTSVIWAIGSTQSISWGHNLGTAERVNIDVSRDGGSTWVAVASNVVNSALKTGTFAWVVAGPATATARIRITWTVNGAIQDVSNKDFTIQ